MSRPKGFKHPKKTKKRIGRALKGTIPWIKGKNHTKETKEKIREANKGKKFSEGHKKKLAESKIGEKHPNWKGGITSENQKIRNSIETRLWREAVFA